MASRGRVGHGATLAFSLGGRSRIPGDAPFEGEFTVEKLGDGRFTCTGPMLKSSVHFRADFEPMAKEVLVVKAPGPAPADPTEFKWTRLRKGVRLRPLGPAHAG